MTTGRPLGELLCQLAEKRLGLELEADRDSLGQCLLGRGKVWDAH